MSWREDLKIGKGRISRLFLGTGNGDLGTEMTATADELNQIDASVNGALVAKGSGIDGTGVVYKTSAILQGGIYTTQILLDMTDLHGCGTAGDIIGKDGGTANCHIGQITAANNGTIWYGSVLCMETPVAGAGGADIDLYAADEGTGAQDAAISGLTETLLLNSGGFAAGGLKYLTAFPAASQYLYLTQGTAVDAAYTAGKFLITLWGV